MSRGHLRPDVETMYPAKVSTTYIYGRHAVLSLLHKVPERVQGLFLSSGAEQEFRALGQKLNLRVGEISGDLARELDGAVHQGVVARISLAGLVRNYAEFMNGLTSSASTSLVLLNEITDPHNVGAIIRSAAAFGASGVLIPTHNQAPITGVVAKASAGMVFSIPLVSIGNVNQTIIDLKERRCWIYGLEAKSVRELSKEKFDAPSVFVIGSEGEGLREKTKEHCDILLRVSMHPSAESLNASVSAGIALFQWSVQHPEAIR